LLGAALSARQVLKRALKKLTKHSRHVVPVHPRGEGNNWGPQRMPDQWGYALLHAMAVVADWYANLGRMLVSG